MFVTIDSRVGGFGDVWMRLLALYTLTRLTDQRPTVLINPALVPMAKKLFGRRLEISDEGVGDVIYTHLGLRHLLGEIARGKRYALGFYWAKRAFRKKTILKNKINDALLLGLSHAHVIHLPDRTKTTDYAGLMEMSALPPFCEISREKFCDQARLDFPEIQLCLQQLASELVPKNADEIVVYPSGSGHQIMPPEWAQKYLSTALFVFHRHDPYASEFERLGLRTEKFGSPEELLQSGAGARQIFCTDSFPSHFWQLYGKNIVLLMSQQPPQIVVHPGFPLSQVLLSTAPCCPCNNRARGPDNTPCEMGHSDCLAWSDPAYQISFKKLLT